MRAKRALSWCAKGVAGAGIALAGALLAASCSSGDAGSDPNDAGDFGVRPDALGEAAPYDGRIDRLSDHGGAILASPHLRIVYIGDEGVDGPPNVDALVSWMLASGDAYWGLLKQYGVGPGTLLESVRVPTSAFFEPGSVQNGLISYATLEARVAAVLHPDVVRDAGPPDATSEASSDAAIDAPGDALADADVDALPPPPAPISDASADGPDASEAGVGPTIGPADGYVLLLPNGVNVALGTSASHTFQTCIDAGGYHGHDGFEPYAVIPPCREGRSALAISHEIAEMVTETMPTHGWYSDDDVKNAGGEIADVCNQPVSQGIDGWFVTQLWSNSDGRCMPP